MSPGVSVDLPGLWLGEPAHRLLVDAATTVRRRVEARLRLPIIGLTPCQIIDLAMNSGRLRQAVASVPKVDGVIEPHPFLSPSWIEAVRAIQQEYRRRDDLAAPAAAVRINNVVTEVPFGDGTILAHMDTRDGALTIELGHLDDPDLTVTLSYDVARKLIVDQDPMAAMQSFMAGEIRVDGDPGKLLALQTASPDPLALEAAVRIKALTA